MNTHRTRLFSLTLTGFLLLSPVGWSHHILGVPHYAYDEEYPQTPVLTYSVNTEGHMIQMTGYPGHPEPGERSSLHVYALDQEFGAPFDGKVTMTIRRDRAFGNDPVIYGPVEAEIEEAIFKFHPTYDKEARYFVDITFNREERPWTIRLPLEVGEPSSPWSAVLLGIGGVLVGLTLVRAFVIKAARREKIDVPAHAEPTSETPA